MRSSGARRDTLGPRVSEEDSPVELTLAAAVSSCVLRTHSTATQSTAVHLRCTTCVSTCRWAQLCAFHAHTRCGAAHRRCAAHEVDRAAPLSRTQSVRTHAGAGPSTTPNRSTASPLRGRTAEGGNQSPAGGRERWPAATAVRLRRTAPRAREARTAGFCRRTAPSSAPAPVVVTGDVLCSSLLSQTTDPRSTSARSAVAGGHCLTCIYAIHPPCAPCAHRVRRTHLSHVFTRPPQPDGSPSATQR